MVAKKNLVVDTYYDYTPKDRHAKEGIAIAVDFGKSTHRRYNGIVLVDTYWSNDRYVLDADEVRSAKLRFDPTGFHTITGARLWEDYAPEDRHAVPFTNHRPEFWVRDGATVDLATQYVNARREEQAALEKVNSAVSGYGFAVGYSRMLQERLDAASKAAKAG